MLDRIEVFRQQVMDVIHLIPYSFTFELGRFAAIVFSVSVIIALVLLLILFTRLFKKMKSEKELKELALSVIDTANAASSSENYAQKLLEIVTQVIVAQSYGFYQLDSKKNQYALKSVLYASEDLNEIGPSYSGLAPFKKHAYIQPVNLKNNEIPASIKVVIEGTIPILIIPFNNGNAMIRVYPVKKLHKKTKYKLDYISKAASATFNMVTETQSIKLEMNNAFVSGNAANRIVDTLGTANGLIFVLIGLSMKITGASCGFYIQKENQEIKATSFVGIPKELETALLDDNDGVAMLFSIADANQIVRYQKGQPEFYQLPTLFPIHNIESAVFIHVAEDAEKHGEIVLLFDKENATQELYANQQKALLLANEKFQDIFRAQRIVKILSDSFLETLRGLVLLIDNVQPHQVGYSELMPRFSLIIAEELGLSKEEKQDLFIAASLSNIGVLGLSNSLFNKTGRYSDVEYEAMKMHAEVGARIIEATLGSKRMADYVRYHHERIDGLGYPCGLKGEEIPMGARIIHVVQFFLANIRGRQGRCPLTFNDALSSIEIAAGTQLDQDCVNALINWVRNKRAANADQNKALGHCWDMRCSTIEICLECPAYKREDLNCWELEGQGIKCHEHGNKCETCYIRTEVLGRR